MKMRNKAVGMPIGVGIGAAIGVAIGAATDNLALWISLAGVRREITRPAIRR